MYITETRLPVSEVASRWSQERDNFSEADVRNILWLEFWSGALPLYVGNMGRFEKVRFEEVLSAIGHEVDIRWVGEEQFWIFDPFFDYARLHKNDWPHPSFISREWAQDRQIASGFSAFHELWMYRTHLRGVCALREWSLPAFWYSAVEREAFQGDPAKREAMLVFWLHSQVFSDRANLGRKAEIKEAARRSIRVTGEVFDDVWKREAPEEFKKSGRRAKLPGQLPNLKPNWLR